jgi:flagellar basal-body rod protein FlgC
MLGVLATSLMLFMSGCVSTARPVTPPTAPTTNPVAAELNPDYVTLPVYIDDTATEREFVQWFRASGVQVAKDASGDDRIFDTPACRAILVRYRQVLHVRLDLIAQNIANVNTTRDAKGASNPYRRRFVVANADGTYQIREDPSPFLKRYLPGHPDADANGYVQFPNVDLAIEKVNANQTFTSYRVITQVLKHFDPTLIDRTGDEGPQS